MLTVFKTIARCIPHAHTLYTPDYEAEALKGVKAGRASGMLQLSCSYTALVQVEKLVFQSVDPNHQLSYFQLVCPPTPRSGMHPESFYGGSLASSEPVMLRTMEGFQAPGTFDMENFKVHSTILQEARHFYKGGSFVIFVAGSPFHELWSEDGGVFNRLSEHQFLAYIQELANRYWQ
jgi:hypothetical protein